MSSGAPLPDPPDSSESEILQIHQNPETGRLDFSIRPGQTLSTDTKALVSEVQEVASLLRKLFLHGSNKDLEFHDQYFTALYQNAAVGLVMSPTNPAAARDGIATILKEVRNEHGSRLRTRQLLRLLLGCGIGSAIALIAAWVLRTSATDESGALLEGAAQSGSNYAIMIAAAFLGMWVSYAGRGALVRLDDMTRPRADLMDPPIRMLYVAIFTAAFATLIHFKIVGINVGEFSTDKITVDPVTAAFLGFCCGFSEHLLANRVAPFLEAVVHRSTSSQDS